MDLSFTGFKNVARMFVGKEFHFIAVEWKKDFPRKAVVRKHYSKSSFVYMVLCTTELEGL